MNGPGPCHRVLVVDQHPVVRAGIETLLSTEIDIEVVAAVADAPSALAYLTEHVGTIDVVTIDIDQGEPSGTDAIGALARSGATLLVFSRLPELPYAALSIRAGARGYLRQNASPGELAHAVRTVAAQQSFVSATGASALASYLADTPQLTPRETEVLRLLATGRRVGQVAVALNISVKTASAHKANIQRKLQIDSLAGLIRYALQHGVIAETSPGP